MKSHSEVFNFVARNPIYTGYANDNPLKPDYIVEVSQRDDGDLYTIIKLPVWPHNPYVAQSVIDFITAIMRWDKTTQWYARSGYIEIHVYESQCDPD